MANPVAHARTLLFAPGNRPERFKKAAQSGADAVVLDLEDSVPISEKAVAREAIEREWDGLRALGVPIVVRVNSPEIALGEEDLDWLAGLELPDAVMLPKSESVQVLSRVHQRLDDIALLPIVESAAGYSALSGLGGAPGVVRLVIGHIDFMADVGFQCDAVESELVPLRFAVSMATRLNRLAPAVDGVTTQIGDDEKLREDVRRAVRFGFGGKLCIHPRQVSVVHDAMRPTEQELEWARKVVAASEAAGGAAVQIDGRMVDLPVVLQAQRMLARAVPPDRT
jgi:citrate lyase subunit beta / citryl-CoA lyase